MAKAFGGLGTTAGLAADRTSMTGMSAGQQFFETDTNKLYLYNGSAWVEGKDYSLSYRPSFQVTSNIGNITVGAAAAVPFNVKNIDLGNNFNTSTYRFTAPVAGLYLFSFQVYAQAAIQLIFYKNGSLFYSNSDVNPLGVTSAAGYSATGNALMSLNSTDYVDVRGRSSAAIYGQHSVFWGYLIN